MKSIRLICLPVIAVLVFSAISLAGCGSNVSKQEQDFMNAVESLGEINVDSYQAIKDAYDLLDDIEYDRQEEIIKNGEDSFMTLKQANIQLYNILVSDLPYPFDAYLDSNRSWSYSLIEENIPEEVLRDFCEKEENRDALYNIKMVDNLLREKMYYRSNLWEFSDQCDDVCVKKIEKCSFINEYWSDRKNKSKTSKSSSDDDWAKEYLEEQFGTSDPDEVDRIGEIYKQKGDDFYDRYGYYPQG